MHNAHRTGAIPVPSGARENKPVDGISKLFLILAIVAVPIGVGGITGGVLLVILISGTAAAVCGSIVVFLGICLLVIPLLVALYFLRLRIQRHNGKMKIVRNGTKEMKVRSKSFRLATENPYRPERPTPPPYKKTTESESFEEPIHEDTEVLQSGKSTNNAVLNPEQILVSSHYQSSVTSEATQPNRIAPPTPCKQELVKQNQHAIVPSPKRDKPIPVPTPVAPTHSLHSNAFKASRKHYADEKSIRELDRTSYSKVKKPHEAKSSPKLGIRNSSYLYPDPDAIVMGHYEEAGTKM